MTGVYTLRFQVGAFTWRPANRSNCLRIRDRLLNDVELAFVHTHTTVLHRFDRVSGANRVILFTDHFAKLSNAIDLRLN